MRTMSSTTTANSLPSPVSLDTTTDSSTGIISAARIQISLEKSSLQNPKKYIWMYEWFELTTPGRVYIYWQGKESDVKWNWQESQIWPNDIFCGFLTGLITWLLSEGFTAIDRGRLKLRNRSSAPPTDSHWLWKYNRILSPPLQRTNNWEGIFWEQVIPQMKFLQDQWLEFDQAIRRRWLEIESREKQKEEKQLEENVEWWETEVIRRHYIRGELLRSSSLRPNRASSLIRLTPPPLPADTKPCQSTLH